MATPRFNLFNLNGTNGFIINGVSEDDVLGTAVSSAGDMNGDGIDDLLISASGEEDGSFSKAQRGITYVVFGRRDRFEAILNPAALNGTNGFVINGAFDFDRLGYSVSSAGDMNGDGINDLLLGAPVSQSQGLNERGRSYIIFGRRDGFNASLNLDKLDRRTGITISDSKASLGDQLGYSVSHAGDLNADGIDDIVIGAPNTYRATDPIPGRSYVVFGRRNFLSNSLDLANLNGVNGFTINGTLRPDISREESDRLGTHVSSIGDVNADGIDDLIIATDRFSNRSTDPGAYVMFGQRSGFTSLFDLSTLNGSNGFALLATDLNLPDTGFINSSEINSADGLGDVNGDGINDFTLGNFVVFGRRGNFNPTLDLANLNGTSGFIVNFDADRRLSSRDISIAGVGDINADGLDDLIINFEETYYLLFGRKSFDSTFNLDKFTNTDGLILDRAANSSLDRTSPISHAGDINADGIDDLIIGVPSADPNGLSSGQSFIIFGETLPVLDLDRSTLELKTSLILSQVDTANSLVNNQLLTLNSPSTTLERASITITNPKNGGFELLRADTQGTSIKAKYDRPTGTLFLTGNDTIVNYQRVISSVTYTNNAIPPDTTPRIIEFTTKKQADSPFSSRPAQLLLTFDGTYGTQERDIMSGTSDNNKLYGFGGQDNLSGGIGDDLLNGGIGNDRLQGKAGNDRLLGEQNHDRLWGDAGNDTLIGGIGNDPLTGGKGQDTFVFDIGKRFDRSIGLDQITDFKPNQDKIILDKDTFKAIKTKKNFASVLTLESARSNAAPILYIRSIGTLFYNPNGSAAGFGQGGQFITLDNRPALKASHIQFQN